MVGNGFLFLSGAHTALLKNRQQLPTIILNMKQEQECMYCMGPLVMDLMENKNKSKVQCVEFSSIARSGLLQEHGGETWQSPWRKTGSLCRYKLLISNKNTIFISWDYKLTKTYLLMLYSISAKSVKSFKGRMNYHKTNFFFFFFQCSV